MPDWVFRFVLPLLWLWLLLGIAANRALVRRRIGRDPIVVRPMRAGQGASGFLERVLSICSVIASADVVLNALAPRAVADAVGIALLRSSEAGGYVGLALLVGGVLLTSVAVLQMGVSWRVGIDRQAPGALVTSGLYARVRHPIYSGMLLATAGLAGLTADLLSVTVAAIAFASLPVQARLEEEFLLARHPDEYPEYLRRTGRFWPPGAGASVGGDEQFVDAVRGLERGDFSRLEPLFRTDPGRARPRVVEWHAQGLLADQPKALAEALSCACFLGCNDVVLYLLAQGGDPAAGAGTGLDAFHWAANRGQLETVRLLIERKAPLETRSTHGGTVLGTAVWSAIHEPRPQHLEIIEALLDAGARLEEAAYPTGHARLDALLRRHGAS